MTDNETTYVWVAEAHRHDERIEQTVHADQEDAWNHINAVADNEWGEVMARVEKHELHADGSARPMW